MEATLPAGAEQLDLVLQEAVLVGQCQAQPLAPSQVRSPCWGGGSPCALPPPHISHCGDEGQGEKAPVFGCWT